MNLYAKNIHSNWERKEKKRKKIYEEIGILPDIPPRTRSKKNPTREGEEKKKKRKKMKESESTLFSGNQKEKEKRKIKKKNQKKSKEIRINNITMTS